MSLSVQLDKNQIIKTLYDDNHSALTIIPKYVDVTILIDAKSAAANFTSDSVNILPFKVAGIVVNWSEIDKKDCRIQFEASVDGDFYDPIGNSVILGTTKGHKSFSLVQEPYKYFQISYDHGTNTSGLITAKYILRA